MRYEEKKGKWGGGRVKGEERGKKKIYHVPTSFSSCSCFEDPFRSLVFARDVSFNQQYSAIWEQRQ